MCRMQNPGWYLKGQGHHKLSKIKKMKIFYPSLFQLGSQIIVCEYIFGGWNVAYYL